MRTLLLKIGWLRSSNQAGSRRSFNQRAARAPSQREAKSLLFGVNDGPRIAPWKRALDIAFALVAIPLLLPMMLMIAALIKFNSKGPVLFRQERVGQYGARFQLYKFRTMNLNADTFVHEAYTSDLIVDDKPMTKLDATDPRLIPCGRLLRAAGLDELPQLINVLRGEMSVVGPRPCIPSEFVRYSGWQLERFHTPPGLTGLWQVSGKNRRTFTEMVDLDIAYVRRRSLWLDLKIIMLTIPAVSREVSDILQKTGKGKTGDVACCGASDRIEANMNAQIAGDSTARHTQT